MDKARHQMVADFEPVCGLSFRDARPFQAGESVVARNVGFPPPPSAFWTAARPLLKAGRKLEARLFALMKDEIAWLPAPLDLGTELLEDNEVEQREPRWLRLAPRREDSGVALKDLTGSSYGFACPIAPFGKPFERCLLTAEQWRNYLSDPSPAGSPLRTDESFRAELRVGTALDGRKARQGCLYSEQVLFLPRDPRARWRFRMALEVEQAPCAHIEAIVRLGGEARLAHLQIRKASWDAGFDQSLKEEMLKRVQNQKGGPPYRVKLCLLTPAVYSANLRLLKLKRLTPAWRPYWLRGDGLNHDLPFANSYQLRLVAAITAKAFPLGAWDSGYIGKARGEDAHPDERKATQGPGAPKPLYRCLPAGSVYFLELQPKEGDAAVENFFEQFWLKTLLVRKSGQPTFFGRMGFGITVIGDWNYA